MCASPSSPGFGLTLVAETTAGHLLSATATAAQGTLPEDLGEEVANMLCEEVAKVRECPVAGTAGTALTHTTPQGGSVDRAHQSLMFQLMALTPEDVSKIRIGPLTQHSCEAVRSPPDPASTLTDTPTPATLRIRTLRTLREFFGIMFKLQPQHDDGSILASCLGTGFKNASRRYQ